MPQCAADCRTFLFSMQVESFFYVKILQICDIIPLTQATVLGRKNLAIFSVRGGKKHEQKNRDKHITSNS